MVPFLDFDGVTHPAWFDPDHSPQIISRLPHSEIESLRQEAKDNTVKMRELLRNAQA